MIAQVDVTDPRGYTRRVIFDQQGRKSVDIFALGQPEQQTYTFQYSSDNTVSAAIDALGNQTNYTYDANLNVTSIQMLANTSQPVNYGFTYEPGHNQMTGFTDSLGHSEVFTVDGNGNTTKITDALGNGPSFSYNSDGTVAGATNANGDSFQFGYSGGDLIWSRDPLGNQATRFPDAAGRSLALTGPLGQQVKLQRTNLDDLTVVTDPVGNQTVFNYDGDGNLLSVTDALNHTTTYSYDNMDFVQTRTDALNRQETRTYDLGGDLVRLQDRNGNVTTYQYDGLRRPTLVCFGAQTAGSCASTIQYSYDAGGRLAQTIDSQAGTVTAGYDTRGRLTSESSPQGSVTYTYDTVGRRTSMQITGQPLVSYTYDNANRLTQIVQGISSFAFAYDSGNRRTNVTYPNGIVASYTYDQRSRVTGIAYSINGATIGDLTYTYDSLGRKTSIGGSLARTNLPSATGSASYDATNELVNWNGISINYDGNGNIVNDGAHTYTWDERNQLVSIDSGATASFAYDQFGRRIGKSVFGTATSQFADGNNVAQELSTSGISGSTISGSLDEYLLRTDVGGSMTFLTDALGSTVALADASGTLQTQYSYDPFGVTTAQGLPSANPFQYTGRENDGTGLYYYRARYYNPAIGRFISEDPARLGGGGVNLYAYATDDPINNSDPFGLFAPPWHELISELAAIANGYGYWATLKLGIDTMNVDFRGCNLLMKGPDCSQNTDAYHSNTHSMAGNKPNGKPQTCMQAFQGAQQQLVDDINSNDIPKALHTIEDSYASGHRGFQYWPGGMPTWQHEKGDWNPSDEAVQDAVAAATQFLHDFDYNRQQQQAGNNVDMSKYFPSNPCGQ